MSTLLAIKDLHVSFATADGEVRAVEDVSLEVQAGECLGVVGESGSGKTQLFLAVLGLLARNGRARGRAEFEGTDLLACPAAELNRVRGARVAMVLQDPMSSLTPHRRVGEHRQEIAGVGGALDQHGGRPQFVKRFHEPARGAGPMMAYAEIADVRGHASAQTRSSSVE